MLSMQDCIALLCQERMITELAIRSLVMCSASPVSEGFLFHTLFCKELIPSPSSKSSSLSKIAGPRILFP